jgi:hypothetical protein
MPVSEQAMHDAVDRHSAETRHIHRLALEILDSKRRAYREYDDAVNAWYRGPDQTYRFPNCIHGTSNWTDYDNICGACEDGYGHFDYLRDLADSLSEAKHRWGKYWEAQHHYIWMISNHYDNEAAGKFSQWAHDKWLVVR